MRCHPIPPVLALLAACFAILLTTLPADAADRGPTTAVVIADADADEVVPDGDHRCRVRVIKDGGDTKTVEIDLSGIGEAIGAAMQGVSRALAELDTVQVVSERHGKRLIIREDGHEAVIDVDAIMGEVNEALALAFAEVGDHGRAGRHGAAERSGHEAHEKVRREVREERDDGRDTLRAEIDSLRSELAALQAELRASRGGR
jgi:hypothetical protein